VPLHAALQELELGRTPEESAIHDFAIMEQWKAQSLEKCIDIYPDLARLILLLRHSPNITQIFTDMLADIFR
jgi:hypothetical protein